jgi:SSS family solute:Na+ symporter
VAVQTYLSFFQGPTFAVLLLGIFWSRTTQWGGLSGLAGGLAVSLLLHTFSDELFTINDPFLYISWWSFVAGFIITIIVSIFTKPYPQEKLYGLVYRLAERQQRRTIRREEAYAE